MTFPEQPAQQAQSQWEWAQPVTLPRWVETPPLEYHQLLRGARRYRWWKPLVALVLWVIYYAVFSIVFVLAVILPYMILSEVDLVDPDAVYALALPDTQNPMSIFVGLGSIVLMVPAAFLALVSVGLGPAKRLWSAALRIRWRWIWRTMLPAFGTIAISFALDSESFINGGGLDVSASSPGFSAQAAAWSALFVVLLVPLQSSAEELIYRGMFMQTLGAWLGGARGNGGFARFVRGPWLPILLPAIAFGFSHIYDVWGLLSVMALAVVAGWLTWRTGGLEAAISLHVVNNLIAFGFLLFGVDGETGMTESGGGPGSLLASIVAFVLYGWWVDRDFRRRDGVRTRIDWVESHA